VANVADNLGRPEKQVADELRLLDFAVQSKLNPGLSVIQSDGDRGPQGPEGV
jgi:hypothetical protein